MPTTDTLLLVPGLMCDHAVWDPLLPALGAHAQCRVIDHGQADSLQAMARQLLDGAPERFALAGHSMGGRVALEVMRSAPQRVTRLALMDTGYLPRAAGAAGEEEAAKRMALLDIARTRGVRAMALTWVQGMVAPHRLQDAALVESIVAMMARRSADVFAAQINALLARPDTRDVLASLQLPTLVLCGREDSWSPLKQHEEIVACAGGRPTLSVIEAAGHMSTMEEPQAVARAMLDWLAVPVAG